MLVASRRMLLWVAPLLLLGCTDRQSTAPDAVAFAASASSSGVQQTPISGMIALVGLGGPAIVRVSPGGICHFIDNPAFSHFSGDITGDVTYEEHNQLTCDFTHLVASGPFFGDVTWNGRTGHIDGQFETNCMPDPTQPLGISCAGVSNARGSGGLEGVQFHFRWGPGWWPFSYSGTAFSQ